MSKDEEDAREQFKSVFKNVQISNWVTIYYFRSLKKGLCLVMELYGLVEN